MIDEVEKLRANYLRLLERGIRVEDAGGRDVKLDASIERARQKLEAAKRGEPTKRRTAELECETARSLAREWSKRTGNALEVRKERTGAFHDSAAWFVYRWVPGEAPELIGPYKTELAACKKMEELVR